MQMKDFGFYRGVNLGGWFSSATTPGNGWIILSRKRILT